jgi:hypothetical protein
MSACWLTTLLAAAKCCVFGWKKTVGGGRKLRYIGQRRNEMWMLLTVSAYNLVRMANLGLVAG